MNRLVSFLVVLPCVCCLATVASADLIGHWTFDEGFADTVGDFEGVAEGDAAISAESKFGAGALEVDGDMDYVDLGEAGKDFDFAGDLTVSAWVRPDDVGDDDDIIIGKAWDGGQTPFWLMLLNEDTARVGHYEDGHQGVDGQMQDGGTFLDGEWHMVTGVVVDQGGTADYLLYIDGSPVAENLSSEDVNPFGTTNTWIGGIDENGGSKWFSGLIDDLRLYDEALDETAIQALMQGSETVLLPGDANMDLEFNQLDLVMVQVSAKYLTGEPATWGEGDWNGAPGGSPGDPPQGDGLFNQVDIIAALGPSHYLTGPYAAIGETGQLDDGQTSIVYNADSGEVAVDAPVGTELTSVNIESAAAIFTGDAAQNLGGSFDNDSDTNIFKATFGSSFGSISFGQVAQAGLSEDLVLNDLTVVGSLAGGGDLGDVDLVYVPEPAAMVLLGMGLAGALLTQRRRRA